MVSDGFSWVGTEFFVGEGVGQVLLDFADVKGGVHNVYLTHFVKWFDDQTSI